MAKPMDVYFIQGIYCGRELIDGILNVQCAWYTSSSTGSVSHRTKVLVLFAELYREDGDPGFTSVYLEANAMVQGKTCQDQPSRSCTKWQTWKDTEVLRDFPHIRKKLLSNDTYLHYWSLRSMKFVLFNAVLHFMMYQSTSLYGYLMRLFLKRCNGASESIVAKRCRFILSWRRKVSKLTLIPDKVSQMLKYDSASDKERSRRRWDIALLRTWGVPNMRNIFRNRAPSPFFPTRMQ